MVSGLGRVILILCVITAELWASYQQHVESAAMLYFSWQLSCSFQMPDRCFMWICGTAPSCSKPSATRWGMMIFQCYCYYVCCVLWMCYECVMDVLWMCYECVMNVLWMCYESVMRVLWECYGCYGCVRYVMDVWGMLWMCEVCYGCVKDVCVMDEWWIFYIYCVSCIVNGTVIVIL